MARFGQAKRAEAAIVVLKQGDNLAIPPHVHTVHTPSGNRHIGPCSARDQGRIIMRTIWFNMSPHDLGIGFAQCKQVGDTKCTKPQRARAVFAATDGGVVMGFGGLGWVQHDEHHFGPIGVPRAGQCVAIGLACRIGG